VTRPDGQRLVDGLAAAIAAATGEVDEERRRIAVALYQLLAQGEPVTETALAAKAGLNPEAVAALLRRWSGVFRDDRGRVTGYGGLALSEMGHRFHADGGRPIYAWCALDPFLIVPLIGRPARVESKDPTTGERVTMRVTAGGIEDLQPESAVVSFLEPDRPFGPDVIEAFCHFVLNFASRESAERWAAEHDGIVILPAADAFQVGLRAWEKFRPPR
jgi:alkylmercury lyase